MGVLGGVGTRLSVIVWAQLVIIYQPLNRQIEFFSVEGKVATVGEKVHIESSKQ